MPTPRHFAASAIAAQDPWVPVDEFLPTIKVLTSMGVTAPAVREVLTHRIGRGDKPVTGPLPLVPRARNAVLQAVEDARRLDHDYLGTEHLLLGLVRAGTGIGALIIESLGVDLDDVRARVLQAVRATKKAPTRGKQKQTGSPAKPKQAADGTETGSVEPGAPALFEADQEDRHAWPAM